MTFSTFNYQFREVLKGWWVFARKAKMGLRTAGRSPNKALLYLINAFWAVPVLIAMRILRPFILIRVGAFTYSRVGHFAAEVGQHKAESLVDKSLKRFDFWYLPDDHLCSNAYWAKITRRWFKVSPLVRFLIVWNQIVPFGRIHSIRSGGTHNCRDVNGYLEKVKLSLPSTPTEEAAARSFMAQFGWTEGDPFVCLLVRDSKYLSGHLPGNNWEYHSYRDSNIQTYIKGIEYLTSRGIYVFRMGKDMAHKVQYSHPRFIDYSFRKDKSDFLDVWLFARCSLCITTASGPDMISDVFRRPLLALNMLPLHCLWSWSNAIHYPKALKWKDSGRILNLTEYLDQTHYRTVDFEEAGIEIDDLNQDQIYEAVREGSQDLLGVRSRTEDEFIFNEKFKIILKSHSKFEEYHGYLHPDTRLSSIFLRFVLSYLP